MTTKYNWNKLLTGKRRKKNIEPEVVDIWECRRTEIERDYDRIVFAAPTRRLSNKTQVFPMEEHDSIRTRLTHSNEVSNLARGAGVALCCNGFFDFETQNKDKLIRDIPSILATIGLVHDMGNPPFGHQGEKAIQDWFKDHIPNMNVENENLFKDFENFDGNAQTLRLVTRLHSADGHFGMDLTMATLSAMIKYPEFNGQNQYYKKGGIFLSEKEIFDEVWQNTGLKEGVRHPLCYIMEICDDTAYATIDVEDTIKKGYASFNDLKNWIDENAGKENPFFCDIYKKIEESISEFKSHSKEDITSSVQKEVSMEIFRAKAINGFLTEATNCFRKDFHSAEYRNWFERNLGPRYEISERFSLSKELQTLKDFTKHFGFNNTAVLKLELEGRNYIYQLMTYLWEGIKNTNEDLKTKNHYEKYLISKISTNYLREFKRSYKASQNKDDQAYAKFQLITDYISGMTESYLQRTHDEILPFYEKHIHGR